MKLKYIVKPAWMVSAYNFTGIDLLRKDLAGLAKYIPQKKSIKSKVDNITKKEPQKVKPKKLAAKESLRKFLQKRNKHVSTSTKIGRKNYFLRKITTRKEKRGEDKEKKRRA